MLPFPESLYQLRSGLDLSDPAAQFGMVTNRIGVSAAAASLNLVIIAQTTTGKLTVVTHLAALLAPGGAQTVREGLIEIIDVNTEFIATIDGLGSESVVGTGSDARRLVTLRTPVVLPAGFGVRVFGRFNAAANANTITSAGAVFYEIPAGTVRR